jgi:glycosidase
MSTRGLFRFILCLALLAQVPVFGQKVSVNPTVSPAVFLPSEPITVTYDVTGTSLANLSNAWIWVWIPGKNIDAKFNVNPATAAVDAAKFTKSTANNKTTWSITFKPSDFFTVSIANEKQMGVLIKAQDWSGGQSTDFILNFGFQTTLTSPSQSFVFVNPNESISITATSPISANFNLYVNDALTDTKSGITNYSYTLIIPSNTPSAKVRLVATSVAGGTNSEVSFTYVLRANSPLAPRPQGVIAGINYSSDPTKVTLCLTAPGKNSVYVLGEFSNWSLAPEYQMKRDGDLFWIELTGLTPGQEYGFQYLVNESLRIADPYADKILDPDDQYIPAGTYPGLMTFPTKAQSAKWYENRVAVFQTNQTPYPWKVKNFTPPKKESLVVYEALIRDLFASGKRNYQTLIDTISYFKRLGINAIELMPIMEFNGNESWGYNPTFMFAPDKYYGTKDKLKEFIDVCHQNGIAVILDITMNHQDMPNPYVLMDFDFNQTRPTPANKWFNVTATHPFNVFFDMNHESAYTKKYLDTVNYYWLKEYKVDGFRFDLSKGFTQTNNPGNVSAWSAYDASRIALLKRMADKIWQYHPNAFVILEHLGDNSEEKELASYRAAEGKGMMLWGKMTDPYNQSTMGFASGSGISGVYHANRGWTFPHLVGYMESHDEERLMYKNLQFGATLGPYNVKSLPTALSRMGAASVMFYTVPGPKMLWQFGELGFDLSINRCENGTVSDGCRLSNKPPKWDYMEDGQRRALYDLTADLIRMKKWYTVFQDGQFTLGSDGLIKHAVIKNKNFTAAPADSSQMSAVVAANFDLVEQTFEISIPHTGMWYNYYTGESFEVTGSKRVTTLSPGGYFLATNVPLFKEVVTSLNENSKINTLFYPNPSKGWIRSTTAFSQLNAVTTTGTVISLKKITENTWSTADLSPGIYVIRGLSETGWIIRRVAVQAD